jgi:hypothetical protein
MQIRRLVGLAGWRATGGVARGFMAGELEAAVSDAALLLASPPPSLPSIYLSQLNSCLYTYTYTYLYTPPRNSENSGDNQAWENHALLSHSRMLGMQQYVFLKSTREKAVGHAWARSVWGSNTRSAPARNFPAVRNQGTLPLRPPPNA